MDNREEQLRARAYGIWQAEGEPHGRDRDHWDMAERELSEATDDTGTELGDATPDETSDVAVKPKSTTRRKSAAAPTPAGTTDDTPKPKTRKPRAAKTS